jgi:hypothetical protein
MPNENAAAAANPGKLYRAPHEEMHAPRFFPRKTRAELAAGDRCQICGSGFNCEHRARG